MDYFWEYKALSVLHAVVSAVLTIIMLVSIKRRAFKTCNTDKIFIVFIVFTLISFAGSINSNAFVELLKFLSLLFYYFVGRLISVDLKHLSFLGFLSILALLVLSVLALTGTGYTTWGSVNTFTGGYYFKTDLAIASLIFLVFTFITLQHRFILVLSLLCVGYLVFKSNARIALPLVVLLPVFILMVLHGKLIKINFKTIVTVLLTAIFGMTLFLVIDLRSFGMLGFDFSNPYSAANTQGRSVIWAALLNAYSDASFFEMLIGLGLDADSKATAMYSQSVQLEGVRAHNSYLYLLVCMGIVGSLIFYWLLFSIFSKVPFILQQKEIKQRVIPTTSCAFLIIFLWLSMTTEIVIRPQLMILLFFFSGLHVQSYLKLKKDKERAMHALVNRT